MNYNSIEEILSAGTTNMTVIRNNTKQDDGTDTITGVNWFVYNGTVASTIYANGNSWIGFGSSSEHLKVNRRDGAMYSLYREEGTLYNYYKFLKMRWSGSSAWGEISAETTIEYDIILWDTGDISLHMISIPTSYNTGTYSLTASSTYSYAVSTSQPDVTFKKIDSGFEVSNKIISLELPCEQRYLIRSGSTYYTVINNVLTQVTISNLTSETFLTSGTNIMPSISLLTGLTNPEILYWRDNEEPVEIGLIVKGTPSLPQIVYYNSQSMTEHSGIEKMEVSASDDTLFSITFDNGQTWRYVENGNWKIASSESEGMTAKTILNISESKWSEITGFSSYQMRCCLPSIESTASKIYVRYK